MTIHAKINELCFETFNDKQLHDLSICIKVFKCDLTQLYELIKCNKFHDFVLQINIKPKQQRHGT